MLVPKDLADLGERCATAQHLGCRGVSQPVRPDRRQTSPPQAQRTTPPTVLVEIPARGATAKMNTWRDVVGGRSWRR